MDHESAARLRSDIASDSGSPTLSATGSAVRPQDLQQENSTLQARLAQLQAELSEKQRLLDRGQAEHCERIEDIVALTGHYRTLLDKASEQAKAQAAEISALKQQMQDKASEHARVQAAEISALKQQVQDLTRRLNKVRSHRDSLLNSTSWRITAPIRAVMRTLRG